MTEIYFLIRHTPFWAIPMIILGAEFGYLFWLRKKKRSAMMCLFIAMIGFMATTYYVWAGGPERAVKIFIQTQRSFE